MSVSGGPREGGWPDAQADGALMRPLEAPRAERIARDDEPETPRFLLPDPIPKGGLGSRSAMGVVIATTSQAARFFIQFGSMVVLARLLQPWQFGLVAMVTPTLSFLYVFADLGLAQAVVQRPKLTRIELSSVFWLIVIAGFLLSACVAGSAPLMASVYHEPRLIVILLLWSPVMALSGLSLVHRALLTREAQFRALAVIDVASALAGAATGILSAMAGAGYWALVISGPATILTASLMLWIACRWRPALRLDWRRTRPLMGAGGYVTTANLGTMISSIVDNILIGAWLGKTALGYYDQGYRLVTQSVAQLLGPVSRVMVPLLIQAAQKGEDYSPTFFIVLRGLCLALWPGLAVGVACAPGIVELVVGDQWRASAPIVSWFCVAAMASPALAMTAWLYLAEGRLRAYAVTSVAGSLTTAASVLLGIDSGVNAVARYVALSYAFLITPATCLVATQRGPVRLAKFGLTMVPYVIAAAVVVCTLWFVPAFANPQGFAGLFSALLFAYALFLLVAVISPPDRAMLRHLLDAPSLLRR
jgi:PST family polysaccharide transporter